jgi:hypothetical protein
MRVGLRCYSMYTLCISISESTVCTSSVLDCTTYKRSSCHLHTTYTVYGKTLVAPELIPLIKPAQIARVLPRTMLENLRV